VLLLLPPWSTRRSRSGIWEDEDDEKEFLDT
jgi:hypothetical protein